MKLYLLNCIIENFQVTYSLRHSLEGCTLASTVIFSIKICCFNMHFPPLHKVVTINTTCLHIITSYAFFHRLFVCLVWNSKQANYCILIYIQQDATLHSLFYLETALHFRVVLPPIKKKTKNCIYSIWYLSHHYCYLSLSLRSWNWFDATHSTLKPVQTLPR
jgi:hypothetical protein